MLTRRALLLLLLLAPGMRLSFAVLADVSGTMTYQQDPPTEADVPHWSTGWPASGVTGWDYVGQIGGTSAVYLGNGWVLTAAHVGSGPFTLNGVTYPPVAKSAKAVADFNGTADLIMFRISPAPALPPLPLSADSPMIGDPVVMIGFGGNHGKTWGTNTVSRIDAGVRSGQINKTIDFFITATNANGTRLITGDSGGGAFIDNVSTGQWELAGINQAIDRTNDSCMVQLSHYAWSINFIRYGLWRVILIAGVMAVVLLVGLALAWLFVRQKRHC